MSIIIDDTKTNDWLALFYFLQFLLSEGTITEDTYCNMLEKLMTFKTIAMNWGKVETDPNPPNPPRTQSY